VRLDLGLAGASLPNGQYRLTVRGAASRAIHDSAGNTLDGDADGTAGGDWVRSFTVDQSIDITPPTATIASVVSPRTSSIAALAVTFTETVFGVGLSDFTLTRNGAPVSLAAAELTGSGSSYTLSGLASASSQPGTYVLTLVAAGSGIADAASNALAADATVSWLLNRAPTAVAFDNAVTTLSETTSTATRVKLADIVVTDDGEGTNIITLSGADAGAFEIVGTVLYLRAGVTLATATKPSYGVTVTVADASAAGSLPTTAAFTLSITGSGITVPAGQTVTDATTHTGSYQLVKQGGGTLILDKANTHSGGTVIEAGTIIVKNAAGLGTGQVRVTAGATLVIDPAAGEVVGGSLVIEEGGFVDLGAGRLRIETGMTASMLVTMLLAAKGDGTWTGTTGLGSTAVAAANAAFLPRTIGWLDNGDGSFTVSFAAPGDTGLDGVVDITDVANFIAGGKLDSGDPATWTEGDFNLDGVVDQLDLADFLGTGLFDVGPYGTGASGMASQPTADAPAAAPIATNASTPGEPTAIESAFAALATDTTTPSTKKKAAFASFR